MNKANQIIQDLAHRPWDLPVGKWAYYQEWNRSLFLHWKIPTDILQPFIPRGLILDICDMEAWVSLVAFTMENIGPRGFPAISALSDFHEVNLRTYVTINGKPGVYFLSIAAQKHLSAWLAKMLSGLPYEKSEISREQNDAFQTYSLFNRKRIIFNIHGNSYRLIVDIEYRLKIVFIVWFGTHKQYDKIVWGKKIPEMIRGLGRGIREFKDAKDNVQREIEDHVNEDRKTTSTTKQVSPDSSVRN
jgi:uncharacterized protein YqjF (DUF2071 family)